MEATAKNAEIVNSIIEILQKNECSISETYSILNYVKGRIEYTSKVSANEKLVFDAKKQISNERSDRI